MPVSNISQHFTAHLFRPWMPNLASAILGETGSEAGVGEFLEGKGYRDLMAGTAGDGFGELHVADARGEAGVHDGTLTQDRCHEVVLDTPAAFQLVGYR